MAILISKLMIFSNIKNYMFVIMDQRKYFNDYFVHNKIFVLYHFRGNYIGQLPYKTGTSGCENLC